MSKDFSFREVEKFVRSDTSELVEHIDKLLSLILLFSTPAIAISKATIDEAIGVLVDLFGIKNELTQLTNHIIEKLTGRKDKGTLSKFHRMEAAYCVICFTAFFEAIEQLLPDITESADLSGKEKLSLSQSAIAKLTERDSQAIGDLPPLGENEILDFKLSLPHPTENFDAQKHNLLRLYRQLAKGFLSFLEYLALWDTLDDRQRGQVKSITNALPEHSWKTFQSQYFVLATKYEEFFIWTNLHEHEGFKNKLQGLSEYIQKHTALAESSQKEIDIGLTNLAEAIKLIPAQIEEAQANKVFTELETLYQSTIEEAVIQDSKVGPIVKTTNLKK